MDRQIPELRKELKKKLHPQRYEHSLSVSFTCISLAMKYGYSLDRAELAGLLHDCAKRYDDETILKLCEKHQVQVTEAEIMAPAVLHAKYGAWMAEHRYGVQDEEVLRAIACHTTGKPSMGTLDKILYVADFMEPRRYKAENLDKIRAIAYDDLDEVLFQIMESTLAYLERGGTHVDPMTREAYEYYKNIKENRKEV